jgi:hypothetical protein
VYSTGYLDWMCKQEDFFKKDTQSAARRYLFLLKNGDTVKNATNTSFDDDDIPF